MGRRPMLLLIESCNRICHHGALMASNLMECRKSYPHGAIFSQNLIITGMERSACASAVELILSHPSHFKLRRTLDLRHNNYPQLRHNINPCSLLPHAVPIFQLFMGFRLSFLELLPIRGSRPVPILLQTTAIYHRG